MLTKKNILWGFFFQASFKLIALIVSIYSQSWLVLNVSESELKNYTVILSYLSIIISVTDFGIPNLIQKTFIKKNTNSEYPQNFWSSLFLLRFISFILATGLSILFFPLVKIQDMGLLLLVLFSQFILVFDLSYRALCDALGRAWQFNFSDFLGKFIILISLLLVSGINLQIPSFTFDLFFFELNLNSYYISIQGLIKNPNIYNYIYISVIAYLITYILDFVWQNKLVSWQKPSLKTLVNYKNQIFYLTLSTIIISLYLKTDVLFLNWFNFNSQTIIGYGIAYKVLESAAIFPGILMPTLATTVKQYIISKKLVLNTFWQNKSFSRFNQTQKHLLEWMFISLVFSSIISLCMFIFGPYIIKIIDSDNQYPKSIEYLYILSLSMIPMSSVILFSHLAIFFDFEKLQLKTSIYSLVLAISLYLVLIPNYGAIGAGIATFCFYIFDISYKFVFLYKNVKV